MMHSDGKNQGVVLDKTIFHPQGGGQPADEGTIIAEGRVFKVQSLQIDEDQIVHYGTFAEVLLFRQS